MTKPRPTWRTVNLSGLKYRVEPAAALPGQWVAYRETGTTDFQVFPTWRAAVDYALAQVAESMKEPTA